MAYATAPQTKLRVFQPPTHGLPLSGGGPEPQHYWQDTMEGSPSSGGSAPGDNYIHASAYSQHMRPGPIMTEAPYAPRYPLPMQHHPHHAATPRSAPPPLMPGRDLRTPSPTPQSYQTLQEVQYQQPNSPPKSTVSPRRISAGQPAPLKEVAPKPETDTSTMRCTDFVAKLWFLLDRPEYSQHIRWNASGESFIFFPTKEFATDVLARLFKHSNVASFVRQLNLYGFQRISHLELLEDMENPAGTGNGAASAPASMQAFGDLPSVPASGFAHSDFIRGKPGTLGRIRPKPSPSRARKASNKKRSRNVEEDDDEDDYERAPVSQRRRNA